jgi:hypothetical protein
MGLFDTIDIYSGYSLTSTSIRINRINRTSLEALIRFVDTNGFVERRKLCAAHIYHQ